MDGTTSVADTVEIVRSEKTPISEKLLGEKSNNVAILGTSVAGMNAGSACFSSVENSSANGKKGNSTNLIKCDICSCEMSSDLVLTSHINGSRHKKRLKALEIVANLKASGGKGIELGPQDNPNAYRCDICSLTVNSPQQLEIHLAGAKHKSKMIKEKSVDVVNYINTSKTQGEEPYDNTESPPVKKRKKEVKSLSCDTCKVVLNSEIQYEQHVFSKKHLLKAKGENRMKIKGSKLDIKAHYLQNFVAGSRYNKTEVDRNGFQDGTDPSNNVNVLPTMPSAQNNRSKMAYNQLKSEVSENSSFNNYFPPRHLINSHRNFGGPNFRSRNDLGGKVFKSRTQVFNAHEYP